MRKTMLPFSPPFVGRAEIDEVVDTLEGDWISRGPKTSRFEREFAGQVDAPAALAVSSGTGALQVALAASGIGPGDEVIAPAMTFCSAVHVIEHSGARPVLADVEPDTLNIDPAAVERAMTPRTRAIIPTHLYGHPAEMDALRALAEPRGLLVLEDAAHALPARYRGRIVGSMGAATAFSFYATKNLTTGEGGMLVGKPELIESARIWSAHGMTRDAYTSFGEAKGWDYDVVVAGFKCNMTDVQAALGLQQLRRLDGFHQRRRQIAARYHAALTALPQVQPPVERAHVESAWHLYAVRLNLAQISIDRAAFIEECRRCNIAVSVHFKPIHLLRYYRDRYGYRPTDFPVAFEEYPRLVTLPLNPRMSDADVDDVVDAVASIVARHRR